MDAIRRAVRRLRGPLEAEVLQVEQALLAEGGGGGDGGGATAPRRLELYGTLLERWRAAGYLSEPVEHKKPRAASLGLDLVTQQDESYGRDVGCEVPPCLLQDGTAAQRRLSVEDTLA